MIHVTDTDTAPESRKHQQQNQERVPEPSQNPSHPSRWERGITEGTPELDRRLPGTSAVQGILRQTRPMTAGQEAIIDIKPRHHGGDLTSDHPLHIYHPLSGVVVRMQTQRPRGTTKIYAENFHHRFPRRIHHIIYIIQQYRGAGKKKKTAADVPGL